VGLGTPICEVGVVPCGSDTLSIEVNGAMKEGRQGAAAVQQWCLDACFRGPRLSQLRAAPRPNGALPCPSFQMTLFDPAPVRPAACVAADPTNVNCQLAGTHEIHLWGVGTWTPYAHMAEHCPSLPTEYYARTPGC
jgi:hypothetical protein